MTSSKDPGGSVPQGARRIDNGIVRPGAPPGGGPLDPGALSEPYIGVPMGKSLIDAGFVPDAATLTNSGVWFQPRDVPGAGGIGDPDPLGEVGPPAGIPDGWVRTEPGTLGHRHRWRTTYVWQMVRLISSTKLVGSASTREKLTLATRHYALIPARWESEPNLALTTAIELGIAIGPVEVEGEAGISRTYVPAVDPWSQEFTTEEIEFYVYKTPYRIIEKAEWGKYKEKKCVLCGQTWHAPSPSVTEVREVTHEGYDIVIKQRALEIDEENFTPINLALSERDYQRLRDGKDVIRRFVTYRPAWENK